MLLILRAYRLYSLQSQSRLNEITDQYEYSSHCARVHSQKKPIQHELLWCNYFSFDVKNYSKSMRRKVFCSLSQEAALFTSHQHIICSISQSQLFSLSYCHTHSATEYHSMPHLTRQRCAHACVQLLLLLLLHLFFLSICFHLDVSRYLDFFLEDKSPSCCIVPTDIIVMHLLLCPIHTLN